MSDLQFNIALCLIIQVVSCNTVLEKTEELHNVLLTNYSKDIRPFVGGSGPLEVNVSFFLTSLNDLDEVHGEMNTVGYLSVVWVDERLTWNPYSYAGVFSLIFPMEKIWTPPLLLGNPSLKISNFNGEITLTRVLYNGSVYWYPGDVLRTKCYPDIYRYPFDAQTCSISLLPWGYTQDEMHFNTPIKHVNTPFYSDNGEWVLVKSNTVSFNMNGFSLAQFYLTFNRRPQFFIVNVILPIIFLSCLNVLVFIIPVESGERVSYSITVLLSFAVFMTLVSDNIPKTSAPMSLLCYYLISIFSGSACVMIATIVNLKIFYNCEDKPIPPKLITLTECMTNPCCTTSKVTSKVRSTTEVEIINVKPNGTIIGNDSYPVEGEGSERENVTNVTWKQVSGCLDTLMLWIFTVYFLGATLGQLLAISFPV